MLKITMRQLEAFVATAEYSSFTKAAEALYLTQSTVSARIQELEQALGASLIVRSARKKQLLTEQGRWAYGMARDILDRAHALEKMEGAAAETELVIGTSTVPAQSLMPELMSGFVRSRPDCRCVLKRGDSESVGQMLARGDVRVGFVGAQPDRRAYESRALLEDRLVLISENSERFQAMKAQGKLGTALLAEPMILREETSGTRRAFMDYLDGIGFDRARLHIVAAMDSPEAVKLSVAQGMGVAVISGLAAAAELKEGKLIGFELDSGGVYRKLYMAWRRDVPLTEMESAFVKYVQRAVESEYDRKNK